MQNSVLFKDVKIDNLQMNEFGFFLFLLKTYIFGTRKNLHIEAVLTSTHNLCFMAKNKTKGNPI